MRSIQARSGRDSMRAQISEEFMIALSAALSLLMLGVFIYQGQLVNFYSVRDSVSASEVSYQVASALNHVYLAGDGTTYSMALVARGMNITVRGQVVTVESLNGSAFAQDRVLANDTLTFNNTGIVTIVNNGGALAVR